MKTTTLAYALITIPDFVTGAQLYDLQGLDDKGTAKALFHLQAQKTGDECLPSYLQQIVAIAMVLTGEGVFEQQVLTDSEPEILNHFFDVIEHYKPTLVTWENEHFTSEIINYRCIKHALLMSPHYENKAHHFNLNQALVSSSVATSLEDIATLLGLEAEADQDSRSLWEIYLAENYQQLYQYAQNNALNTYQIYQRYQLTHGMTDQKTVDYFNDKLMKSAAI
ncbi:MAG: ribonuclease H-like domain-containing protein [Cocleimonas sp.]|nr:ribonuclease H-like domain-containing protein [Cocleimonas sp.]